MSSETTGNKGGSHSPTPYGRIYHLLGHNVLKRIYRASSTLQSKFLIETTKKQVR